MARVQDLQYPDGALYASFPSYGDAWREARRLERMGYVRPRSAGRHTHALKPGKYVVFKHAHRVWVFWFPRRSVKREVGL